MKTKFLRTCSSTTSEQVYILSSIIVVFELLSQHFSILLNNIKDPKELLYRLYLLAFNYWQKRRLRKILTMYLKFIEK